MDISKFLHVLAWIFGVWYAFRSLVVLSMHMFTSDLEKSIMLMKGQRIRRPIHDIIITIICFTWILTQ